MDTPSDESHEIERAALRKQMRATPSPAKRGGIALTLLALMLFVWPQTSGTDEIGGVATTTLGWIALAAGWVLLIAGIVIRARKFRALTTPRD